MLDARPFVLARALRMLGGSYAHQPVAALEWDRSGTTFCVAVGGNPLFARELRNCGFERLAEPVAAALGLPAEETYEVLAAYGLPGRASRRSPARGAGGGGRGLRRCTG